jgi:segregation and condensation protein A
MDLLLHLVREQEVEIQEVEITRVIEGYLGYLDALRDLDIELAAEFLLMAATLMSIKARSLLPREEVDLEDELDPKDELIQRLLEYRRFKEASQGLHWSQLEREQLAPRGAFPELDLDLDRPEPTLDLGELTAWDLLGVFSRLMRETLANRPHHVAGDPRPLRYYVTELARRVRTKGRVSLRSLLTEFDDEPTRETLVGAFCALLELVKLGVVTADQPETRGEIDILFLPEVDSDLDHLLDGTRFDDELDAAGSGESQDEPPEGEPEVEPEPADEPADEPAEGLDAPRR